MKKGFTTIKRLLSLIMVFAMVLTLMPTVAFAAESETRIIYLDTGGSTLWDQTDAWFTAWVWGSNATADAWYTLTDVNGTVYRAEIPADYTNIIFCRMDPSQTDPSWDNGLWNQTDDLTIDEDNYYTITGWGGADGEWSDDEPTLTIAGTISAAGWDPASGEKLTDADEDGIYEYTYTNVSADTYEFKVTDGTLDNSWGNGSGNYTVSVAYSGSTVAIKFNAEKKTITTVVTPPSYGVTFNGTGVTSNGAAKATAGSDYTATLTAAEGYALPETVTVTVGGTAINTHTFEDGVLTIPAASVTGAIGITAEGVKEQQGVTVYCINSSKWDTVAAYGWIEGGAGTAWPGVVMTKTDKTVNGFDVYSITFDTEYTNIIFNNNNNGSQTPDLTLENGKYYDVKNGTWYASLSDVPAVDPLATDRYLVGSFNGWSTTANEFKLDAENSKTGYVSLELAAETAYEFKVIQEGTWTSCDTSITGTVSDLAFSSSVSGNVKLTTTIAGIYVFAFNTDTSKLSVTYPAALPAEYDVTFNGTNVTSDGAAKATAGSDYTATLTAAEGYALPETITVKCGETDAVHTYNSTTGELKISAANITGDITITAEGVEEETESSTITVYFRNDWLWTDVCVYYWDANGNNSWPGQTMTKVDTVATSDGERDVYSATIPANVTGIIFNGIKNDDSSSRDQTPNIEDAIADGNAYYIYWDGTNNKNAYSTFAYTPSTGGDEGGDNTDPTSYEVTFHFANNQNWSTVNLYTWSADGKNTQLTGGWPGVALQEVDGYYSATVAYQATTNQGLNFIFNNGSAQTVDLKVEAFEFVDNKAEKWVVLTTQTDGKYNADILDSADAIVTSPVVDGTSVTFEYKNADAGSVEVRGTMNSWETGAAMTKKNDCGVWTVTLNDLEPGSYEYKFYVDGEWVSDPCNPPATEGGNSTFLILDPDAEDTNKVTVNIHFTRAAGYEGWNLWVWSTKLAGHQVDFTGADENGAKVATIEFEDARAHQNISFIPRYSTTANEWEAQEATFTVDLADIVSGTIDYYVTAGSSSGTLVLGTDVVKAVKLVSAELDYDQNTIVITTGTAIEDPENAFELIESEDAEDFTIADVSANGTTYTLTLEEDQVLDLVNLYKYQVKFQNYPYAIGIDSVYASDKFAEEFTYTGTDLGATWSSGSTTFKVWAPTAEAVSVKLYASGTEGTNDLEGTVEMTAGVNGTWVVTVNGDLNGKYYTYSVTVDGEEVEAVDPYARTTGVNGNRGMVIDLDSTDPADGWSEITNKPASYTDAVIYELHVRDFSIDDSSGVKDEWRGKFLGLTQTGTKTAKGTTTGLDYLKDLGITHVHLLPVYDYASVDETTCSNFNWGYDPQNYNTPEGSYSTNPYDGATRVKEMKEMVDTLHEKNIGVIMDVVYNHVYDADTFCFNNIVPRYFSRVNSNTSGCGNDTASEREMVRKYIVESVLYWAKEYHIDGFRFDLVGLLDVQTINEIVTEVHKYRSDILFYGEGWDMDGTNKEPGTVMAKQGNASQTSGFAYFSDSMRNNIGGNNGSSTGFASGAGNGAAIAADWMAKPWWTTNPQQVVQYASCHDNFTLIDKLIKSTGASGVTSDIIKMNNLAAAFYMTAQGIPFIHAGEEFLREKVNESGARVENSYNASDYVNHLEWSNLDNTTYADNVEYYKGLIAFRAAHPALRYNTAAKVSDNVRKITTEANLLTYRVDGYGASDDDILVIFNANNSSRTVTLPDGEWTICINGTKAGTASLGTATGSVSVDAISAMVLTKADEGQDATGDETGGDIPADGYKTMYFTNTKGWSAVYAYAWNSTGALNGAWPGSPMTYLETNDYGQDIYYVIIPNSATGLIFNNGSGTQTGDLTPGVDGTGYYIDDAGACEVYKYRDPVTSDGNADEYFLVGYINGADYVGSDYKFDENGQYKVTFGSDSYVYVRNGNGTEEYMTDGWLGTTTSATLYDIKVHTLTQDKWDKLIVPGGVEVTFTLVVNEDNTVTLRYDAAKDQTSYSATDTSGIQNGVTLHCWNWSFQEIEKNMAAIAEQGYTAIQTSPVQPIKETTTSSSVGDHWWVYYQPVDFVITTDSGNALGTKSELQSMIAAAHKYGIKVIVDVVANHLANETGNNLSPVIPAEIRENTEYWHDITTNITSWSDREDMTQHCMGGLPDLNTANDDIQNYVLTFLKECIDAGVDGFRFDAAKSIETPEDDSSFASDFWSTVVGGAEEYAKDKSKDVYSYGEILDDPAIKISAYTKYMAVTDNSWGNTLRGNIAGGTAAMAAGYNKAASASQLVLWAESHDTYADGSSSGVTEANINKTWALVAARANAMGLYLARPENTTQLLGVGSETAWANPEVKAVNVFHNAFHGTSEVVSNEGNISYVERGTTGAVLVNAQGTTASVSVTAKAMTDGTYTDQITGNAFTVADGKITGEIGSTGIAVIYNPVEPEAKHTITVAETTGGTVEVSNETPVTGETVIITVAADAGKMIDTITVTDAKGEQVEVTETGDGTYTYVQPDSDVKVAVTFKDKAPSTGTKHTVTIKKTADGKVRVSSKTPVTGETVTITVMPNRGKVADKVTVTDQDGKTVTVTNNGDGTYTYVQPDSDVTVAVIFKDKAPFNDRKHTVTVKNTTGGTVEVSDKTPETGDTVIITVTPNTGRVVKKVIVTDENGKAVAVTDKGNGTYTFVQPDSNVTVKVTFKLSFKSNSDSPLTGDNSRIQLWSGVGLVSLLLLFALLIGKRKKFAKK